MTYTCPVCGFEKLEEPPKRFEICPSCGTEFGNDDYFNTHEELTQQWIAGGMKWWDEEQYRPLNWSPVSQLRNIGIVLTPEQIFKSKVLLKLDIKSDIFAILQIRPSAFTSATYVASVSTIKSIPKVNKNLELPIKSTPILV